MEGNRISSQEKLFLSQAAFRRKKWLEHNAPVSSLMVKNIFEDKNFNVKEGPPRDLSPVRFTPCKVRKLLILSMGKQDFLGLRYIFILFKFLVRQMLYWVLWVELGVHLAMFRAYFCLCLGITSSGLRRDHMGCQRLNQVVCMQRKCLNYYFFGLLAAFLAMENIIYKRQWQSREGVLGKTDKEIQRYK